MRRGDKVSVVSVAEAADGWLLRRATLEDVDGLHALGAKPLVHRYLFDGVVPDKEFIASRVAQSVARAAESGLGMWMLENSSASYAGCVELRPYPSPRSAELAYLLDPVIWGKGLAVRMAWTAITQAFLSLQIDSVIAGADVPNTASLAVMRRLGMQFLREIQYSLGFGGVEYVLHHHDTGPMPPPALLPMRGRR